MKFALLALITPILLGVVSSSLHAADPIRIFIRSGPKSHGPGAHDYPRFLKEWVPLLNERGAVAEGGNAFPAKEQLDKTDVLILHAQEAGNIAVGEERKNLLEFLKRGGGMVVIHAGAVSRDPDWFKSIVGGSWRHGTTKWLEGPMHLYFTDRDNPITRDCSNWAMDDEIYYDMDILPEVTVLAGAYTPKPAGARNEKAAQRAGELTGGGKKVSIYDIQPQMWTYERKLDGAGKPYRAFVSIPGHLYENFNRSNYRAILLRGIAWAAGRENADMLCKPEELGDGLRYVEGGPVRPEESAEKLEVHPDFDISLVASEPLINKPMNIDWDEKGRLWVCETPEYPNGRRLPLEESKKDAWRDSGSVVKVNRESGLYPGAEAVYEDRQPMDRISILTDTNGDGVMDSKKVFADKLELVTSFCFYRNGVIACSAPDIWFLEDTDGDDVADRRTKLYTGLGTGDTHAVINNLRWGQDGWIYATHGYSAGTVTSPDGAKTFGTGGSGVVRFKPDGSAFEQYSSKGGNTWGLDITWDGQVFWTQPTSGTVFFHTVLPEYVLAKGKMPGATSFHGMIKAQKSFPLISWPEQAYVQIDQVGQFTAAAGCAIYEGGAWPEKWNYSYFTTEPTINIVHHQFVKKDGVTYTTEKEKGREETEFIRSRDLWFRPIETRIGPDGNLYLVDFYNQAVIHNDTRGPRHGPANAAVRPDRDHYFGRIWKVTHRQAKKLEVPSLSRGDIPGLTKAMASTLNAHVRHVAWRLISEAQASPNGSAQAASRDSGSPRVGSEALRIYEDLSARLAYGKPKDSAEQKIAIEQVHHDVLNQFAKTSDVWVRSAIIAAASEQRPLECVSFALQHSGSEAGEFVAAVLPAVMQGDATAMEAAVSHLLQACATAPSKADSLKIAVLSGLVQHAGLDVSLKQGSPLSSSLKTLLTQPATAGAALPLASRWDKDGILAAEVKTQLASLNATVNDKSASEGDRISAARALIGVGRDARAFVVPALSGEGTPAPVQAAIIQSLGESGVVDELVTVFASLRAELRPAAFDEILKRPKASLALLAALKDGRIKPADIGPGNVARLRTHPNKEVSRQAAALMDILSPVTKEKNELIARLIPEVTKPGNAANGKMLFTAACAVCHKFGDVGVRDVGPPLAGMGAHGPAELLLHIVDPNREVDPSFWQWNITTKKGETLMGVIVSENAASVTLRNQGGDLEIKKEDIARRENTRRSLMPEGLEALGPEMLRDILAFVCGSEQSFRVLDLREVYSADTRRGLFQTEEASGDTVHFAKFGNVTVEGVPFFIMDPARSSKGANVVVLKGGGGKAAAQSHPQRVEITANVTAKRLHLLSGIAGWGWPATKDRRPAMKITIMHADGSSESTELLNAEHFSDYNRVLDVPGSSLAEGLVTRGQLRALSVDVKKTGPVSKIILESYDNGVTPVVVAVTADLTGARGFPPAVPLAASGSPSANSNPTAEPLGPKEGGKGDGKLPPVSPVSWEPGKTKVLLIGGGSSHNFARFFGEVDGTTLKDAGFTVHYTEDRDQAVAELANADVAVISVNRQFFDTPAYRKALLDRVAAGKGVIMMHPGTWFAYANWPELNARIVGGGSRGHDKLGPFSVHVRNADHPIMKGVPATFEVVDELYYVNAEPDRLPPGTAAIEVLAETSPSQKFGRSHPSVWITRSDTARIACIALGHDERVHEHPAFKTMLVNAVQWCAGR